MIGVIDRFEGNYAVVELEGDTIIHLDREIVPKEAKEGDVLNIGDKITINQQEREKKEEEIEKLIEGIFVE